ncbi:hypothetical protein AMTR_s00001p00272580 [Amborella trichopoda]|uniref:Uncharacterized protein n=1 Tax=Amborella trichopoda TaxID=13333 RepID=W1NN10_AMBTC|nr:hypothetical protein AMTR_s00001p00272580 [Amborella trichopoda]
MASIFGSLFGSLRAYALLSFSAALRFLPSGFASTASFASAWKVSFSELPLPTLTGYLIKVVLFLPLSSRACLDRSAAALIERSFDIVIETSITHSFVE